MSISAATLYRLLNTIMATPGNAICKRTVCTNILKEMEADGEQVTEGFKKVIENMSDPDDGKCV